MKEQTSMALVTADSQKGHLKIPVIGLTIIIDSDTEAETQVSGH
jgi:hypothetical protein